ncbi:hypothetical protein [Bradyrhizobium sp. Leaf401]|uniref:hypothetical protein n=1 Tax=Bradyrhizobium sp. Leaf401 TaxID=2876564 RepID=UPI001E5CD1EF|nr:hypothetical protein [Bradyrhizobium sp. Leaf401]
MVSLFISHPWTETEEYEKFVFTLDRALNREWTNHSVPQSQAIDILADEDRRRIDKLAWLKEKLWRAQIQLQDPKLPNVLGSRYVYRDGEVREVPTVVSVKTEIEGLNAQIQVAMREKGPVRELERDIEPTSMPKDYFRQPDKYLGAYVEDYPALSAAIRDRIKASDLVFLLLTPMILPNRWVYYEYSMCGNLGIPIVGVRLPSTSGVRDLELGLLRVLDAESDQIDDEIRDCLATLPERSSALRQTSPYR